MDEASSTWFLLNMLAFLLRLPPASVTADELLCLVGFAARPGTLTVEATTCADSGAFVEPAAFAELFLVSFEIKTTFEPESAAAVADASDCCGMTVIWLFEIIYYAPDAAASGAALAVSSVATCSAAEGGTFKVMAAEAPFAAFRAAAILAACFCWAFSFRRAAAASLRFWFAVFVVSIMIRFTLAEGLFALVKLLLASPPRSQLLSLADLPVCEADPLVAAAPSGTCGSFAITGVGCAAGLDGGFLAAQSWHENGKLSMSYISAYRLDKGNFQNKHRLETYEI